MSDIVFEDGSEPIFDDTTERIYSRLPEHYRRMDTINEYQFKKYISGIASVQDIVTQLVERFSFTPLDDGGEDGDTSDLVDPETADLEWLPWLGQLFGAQISASPLESNRQEVITASNGFGIGTTAAIAAAVRSELIGTQTVRITQHATNMGPGGQWDMLVSTLSSETLVNLVDDTTAQTLSASVWDTSYISSGYDPNDVFKLLVKQNDMYQNRALSYKLQDTTWTDPLGDPSYGSGPYGAGPYGTGTSDGVSSLSFVSRNSIDVTPTDNYNLMVSLGLKQAQLEDRTVIMGLIFYDTNGSPISGNYQKNVNLTGQTTEDITMQQFNNRFVAPDGSVSAKILVTVVGFNGNDEFRIAQPGMREQDDIIWVPSSADPVQAVIDKNAKPAGIKLWYSPLVSNWDSVTASGTRTWSDLEQKGTWTAVEESK